ncbi:replication initiator protein A [Listeria booriae]|uniref:replication initiator protein A n=1 Tax=Listeria booriae TaxID=1552123 RepID=UPI001624B103|nr:replication initiator protein A [Listeria booriae]MBC2266148.1 replication initiator protein A [Listeria booriae]
MYSDSPHQFYNIYQEYSLKFYQLPKVFFTNELYKNMSNHAKIAYAVLQDRLQLSIKNNWYDNDGNIYFIFTNENLKDILNIKSNSTLQSVKNELIAANLMSQERRGLNKANRLYLLRPIVRNEDIYSIDRLEANTVEMDVRRDEQGKFQSGSTKTVLPDEGSKSIGTEGSTKIVLPGESLKSVAPEGSTETVHQEVQFLYTNDTDFNELKEDTYKDTLQDTEAEQNRILLDNFSKINELSGLSNETLEMIATFSSDIKEADETIGIIFRAKKKIEDARGIRLDTHMLDAEIQQTLLKNYRKFKTDENIKNHSNYLFGSLKNFFEDVTIRMSESSTNLKYPKLHEWLDK